MALPPPSDSSTALITGASSGIGTEFARQLAARGLNVTLVARRRERLESLAKELKEEHGVRADVSVCDLTSAAARGRMIGAVKRRGLDVEILVNNAGFGSGGRFHELDPDGELAMVRTNVEAVLHLCTEFVPPMVDRGRGAVLNVASVAAFQPVPRQATYAATKAFVLSFTDALSADLHGTGVTATSLCPGPVPTEFGEVAEIDENLLDLPGVSVSPEDTARAAIEGMDGGKRVVVPGPATKVTALVGRFAPRWLALETMRRFYPVGK
ncbi:MAG: SDR family oxidoreductase [Actinomycetota bacterium]|nr:SDR family oxidoreductase [Actinomycetota bacterium]